MTIQKLSVVILAAGKGTRMKSPLPKVLHTLAGRPMIGWLLETVEQLAPDRILVVTGPDMPALEQAVKPHKTVVQETRNGTGGALKVALPLLEGFDGDVLVLLGDAPLLGLATLKGLIETRRHAGIAVLGARLQDPFGYGRLILGPDHAVRRIVEEKDATREERAIDVVNAGAFCIDGARLAGWVEKIGNDNAAGEYYLTDLPAIAAYDGVETKAYLARDPAEMMGCNSRADLARLDKTLQAQLAERMMDHGVTMLDPASVYLWHDTVIGAGSVIEPHVIFGAGVRMAENVTIKGFSHIEGADIASDAVIGPFARIRPETVVGPDVRVGNFVEIKKSTLGAGSKINHLAYVGDCTMGQDVNFSAGAITVNYDGYSKHQTVIGDGVMVGSNVNLVAPVMLGDGAFIAAGSTITADVPPDSLTIAREPEKVIEGGAVRYRAVKARKKKV